MEHTQTDRTLLTHQVRRTVLNPIRERIRALQAAMVQVIKERILEWQAAGMGTRIGIEGQIVFASDDYDTLFVTAVDMVKGVPCAIITNEMSSTDTQDALEYLPVGILAEIIDDLHIDVPERLIPVAEQESSYTHILKAFERTHELADELKDALLAELGKTHDVFALDIAEPPSDEELGRIYPVDAVDHAICFKDGHDNICCFEEFSVHLEQQKWTALFSDGRNDFYIRPRNLPSK